MLLGILRTAHGLSSPKNTKLSELCPRLNLPELISPSSKSRRQPIIVFCCSSVITLIRKLSSTYQKHSALARSVPPDVYTSWYTRPITQEPSSEIETDLAYASPVEEISSDMDYNPANDPEAIEFEVTATPIIPGRA